jgi:hypothetical protein
MMVRSLWRRVPVAGRREYSASTIALWIEAGGPCIRHKTQTGATSRSYLATRDG